LHFLYISRWSISELETQIIIANKLDFINENDFKLISENIEEIWKMLSWLINSLNNH
jgi:four helix bundle protein